MRKDLRLGLGIGALALLFAITFLVVRNHTANQADAEQGGPAPVALADGGTSAPPGANVPAATPGGGTNLSTVILPPLQPVSPGPTQPKAVDPFERQSPRTTPIGAVPAPGNRPGSNWDVLLSEGRREPVSSAALNHTPAPSVTSDPVRQVTHVEPIAPRPSPIGGHLSAATGRPYTIRQNDTFSSIAKQTYGAEKYYLQIEQANPNINTMKLRPGQQIILPELTVDARATRAKAGPFDHENDNRPVDARSEYRVDTGDSLYRISMRLYGSPRMIDAIHDLNRASIPNPDRLRLGMILRLPQPPDGK